MKKSLFVVMIIAAMVLCFTAVSFAKDVMINKEVKVVTIKKDKNNKEYVRFIVNDTRTLNGVSYQRDISIMAFGDLVTQAKTIKKGQTLKAIVSERDYHGNPSFTILSPI